MDCGPTCLRMIAAYHGKIYTLSYLRQHCHFSRTGVSLQGITEAAETIGFRVLPVKIPFSAEKDLPSLQVAPLPCIVHWNQMHFVVVYRVTDKYVWVADPAAGKHRLSHADFKKSWQSDGSHGVALLLDPTPDFYAQEGQKVDKTGFGFLFKYLIPYRRLVVQLVIGLLLASLFQLIFPFLTQAVVDIGIKNQNLGFVQIILIGQLMVFVGQMSVGFLQSWILLHISTRINVSLIADFLLKLMRLPIGYFDAKMTGDLLQRIGDHSRIESFLTGSTLNVLFSAFNFLVFGAVLWIYDVQIFLVFLIASVFYIAWIFLFLKKRREVDYLRFQEMAENQSSLIEIIHGMPEIKLQNSERKRRQSWMNIQAKLFTANMKSLAITQYQDVGANSISRFKDIIIAFLSASAVIRGDMTLGMMVAVQYIVGQLNAPLQQFVSFIRLGQDARISIERLSEIHEEEEEIAQRHHDFLPQNTDLRLENVSFRYNPLLDLVLEDIDLTIPAGKITAIVGTSGSGKTTLVKLLLGFYQATKGTVRVGNLNLAGLDKSFWREQCGAVLQDGYIFSDTIANNISESEESTDNAKLLQSVETANIQGFIENLPLGYNTMIGSKGNGVSQGQKQRLLIARAVYKNPKFLFFDEATNALDAKNERIIVENLNRFFTGRTVVVVAHRLSTVKHADQIVVLEKGRITEVGTHRDLVEKRGSYYSLVKNQLELGG